MNTQKQVFAKLSEASKNERLRGLELRMQKRMELMNYKDWEEVVNDGETVYGIIENYVREVYDMGVKITALKRELAKADDIVKEGKGVMDDYFRDADKFLKDYKARAKKIGLTNSVAESQIESQKDEVKQIFGTLKSDVEFNKKQKLG